MINIICSSRYKISRPKIRFLTEELFNKLGIPSHYLINIVFVGRTKMKTIAVKYKKHTEALPVLSFAYDPAKDNLLGEIFICYPLAILLAAERNKKTETIIEELIKHGVENIIKTQS